MDGTVLVADDDRTIRTVLTQALTRAGCKVHATSSLTTLMRWVGEGKGDVVITGDIPLAARCIENGALVLKHNGEPLTSANIGNVLATRDLMTDMRAADPFRQGGGKPFSKTDRARFLDALERMVRAAAKP